MAHTPELVKAFGVNKGHHGRGRYPLARLVTLCLAGTMTIVDYAVGRYRQGEWSLLSSMFAALRISFIHAIRALLSFSSALCFDRPCYTGAGPAQ